MNGTTTPETIHDMATKRCTLVSGFGARAENCRAEALKADAGESMVAVLVVVVNSCITGQASCRAGLTIRMVDDDDKESLKQNFGEVFPLDDLHCEREVRTVRLPDLKISRLSL